MYLAVACMRNKQAAKNRKFCFKNLTCLPNLRVNSTKIYLGCKKVRGQEGPATKALISAKAKKFSVPLLKTFNSKEHMYQFAECYPDHDWFCHPWPPFG